MAVIIQGAFLAFFLGVPPAGAWTIPAYVELGWPRPQSSIYEKKAGLPRNSQNQAWRTCNDDWYLTKNATRIPFPVRGSRLQFDMLNSTGEFSDHHFAVDLSLRDLPIDFSGDYILHRFYMRNFQTAPSCSQPVDMLERIAHSSLSSPVRNEEELVGMNVTLRLEITDITGERGNNEIVHQVRVECLRCPIPFW